MSQIVARGFIVVVAVLLLGITFSQMMYDSDNRGREVIQTEMTACVIETCITDNTVGDECIIQKPKISKIRITVDDNAHRPVLTTPTDIECR